MIQCIKIFKNPTFIYVSLLIIQIQDSYYIKRYMKSVKRFISQFDMFSAQPTLRAEGESEVMNLCGSLLSICLFGIFVYIFITSTISTIKLQRISASEIVERSRSPDSRIGNITIAVGLQWRNLSAVTNIFQLRAFLSDRQLNLRQISVFPCTREMFDMIDDVNYATLDLKTHLCIQRENVQLYGQFGTPIVQFLFFNLSICNNATSPVVCASPTVISNYFANAMIWHRFMACSMVIINTGINPTKENPVSYFAYEKTLWLLFNLEQQMFIQTFVGTYQITTDTSFLPFEESISQSGSIVEQCVITTIVNYLDIPVFIQSYVFPSPIHRSITRTFGKFDDVLSYVGGLFGIVLSFIGFFMLSFNQYKYELRVSEGSFSFQNGHLARQSDLHFGKYLKYVTYDWIKSFTCFEPKWKDCKAIDQAREEAVMQIDVKHLLKRLSHLQKVIATFVSPKGETVMYMAQQNSLDEVKRRRRISEYCSKFTHIDNSPTINTFQNIQSIFKFSFQSNIKTQSSLVYPSNQQVQQLNSYQQPPSNPQEQSLSLMQKYLKRYMKKYKVNEKSFQIDQDDLKAESELAEAFYEMEQQDRIKVIRKIPLGILYRINKTKNNIKIDQSDEIDENGARYEQLRKKRKRKRNKSSKFVVQLENLDHTLQLDH